MDEAIRTLPRTFSLRTADGRRRRPTYFEVLGQYWRTTNCFADRRHALRALLEVYHGATLLACIVFVLFHLSYAMVGAYIAMTGLLVNVFNTIWYHRYCSHSAFKFSRRLFGRMLLWANPLGIREEIYAIIHYIHHTRSDEDDDPYGPHLGAVGSYLAAGEFEIDSDVTAAEFDRLKQRLAHIPMPFASLGSFRRWRSIEAIPHYLSRWVGANVLWGALWYALGGAPLLLAWYASIFTMTFLMRSFNAIGHASSADQLIDGWDFDRTTLARNQRLYGYFASEWHNNHHRFRSSANCGFLRGQLDACFVLVKVMHRLGVVSQYTDHAPQFRQAYGRELEHARRRPEGVGVGR